MSAISLNWKFGVAFAIGLTSVAFLTAKPAIAQTKFATVSSAATGAYPASVIVRNDKPVGHYATKSGMTLYVLDTRIAYGRSGARHYCTGPCALVWTEFAAPAEAQQIGDWGIGVGIHGPQWTYKNKPVFTFVADNTATDMRGEKYEDLWSVISYIPSPPKIAAPPNVVPSYIDNGFQLADSSGRRLFTPLNSADCPKVCSDWLPFTAGMAARDIGAWVVERSGEQPQWRYRGKLVFIAQDDGAPGLPAGATTLTP